VVGSGVVARFVISRARRSMNPRALGDSRIGLRHVSGLAFPWSGHALLYSCSPWQHSLLIGSWRFPTGRAHRAGSGFQAAGPVCHMAFTSTPFTQLRAWGDDHYSVAPTRGEACDRWVTSAGGMRSAASVPLISATAERRAITRRVGGHQLRFNAGSGCAPFSRRDTRRRRNHRVPQPGGHASHVRRPRASRLQGGAAGAVAAVAATAPSDVGHRRAGAFGVAAAGCRSHQSAPGDAPQLDSSAGKQQVGASAKKSNGQMDIALLGLGSRMAEAMPASADRQIIADRTLPSTRASLLLAGGGADPERTGQSAVSG